MIIIGAANGVISLAFGGYLGRISDAYGRRPFFMLIFSWLGYNMVVKCTYLN